MNNLSVLELNKLKQIIDDNYLFTIKSLEKNENSTVGNVYIIYTDKNKYVLKIYDDLNHTESMIKLHSDLCNKFNIPKIIINKNNESHTKLENKFIVIYSFLDGIQLSKKFKNIPSDVIKKLALELRHFHDTTNGLNNYNLNEIPFEYEIGIKRYSTLHFDLTRDNIFYIGDKIGFIDFDDAKYGPSACDVAIIISIMFFSKKRGVDIENLNLFLESYYNNDLQLKNQELPYIKEFAIKWIDYVISNNEFNCSIKDSFNIKRELIEKYMNL